VHQVGIDEVCRRHPGRFPTVQLYRRIRRIGNVGGSHQLVGHANGIPDACSEGHHLSGAGVVFSALEMTMVFRKADYLSSRTRTIVKEVACAEPGVRGASFATYLTSF
jgi:hypothetical protein